MGLLRYLLAGCLTIFHLAYAAEYGVGFGLTFDYGSVTRLSSKLTMANGIDFVQCRQYLLF